MGKPFKTIEQQIDLLKKRNLKFKNKEKAREILLKNNYYNLINNYSKFMINSFNTYEDNTYFENILMVQNLDRELKKILFEYLTEIESIFKAMLIYEYCNKYQEEYAFLNVRNYDKKNLSSAFNVISTYTNIINFYSNDKKANAIKHYINNHNDVPLWGLSSFLTLGQSIYFYNTLTPTLKYTIVRNHINKNLSSKDKIIRLDVAVFSSILENIRQIRNVVAHNNRLINFKCKNNIKYINELHNQDKRESRQTVYSTILTFKCFFNIIEYTNLKDRLVLLIEKFYNSMDNKNHATKVLDSLGFPSELYLK